MNNLREIVQNDRPYSLGFSMRADYDSRVTDLRNLKINYLIKDRIKDRKIHIVKRHTNNEWRLCKPYQKVVLELSIEDRFHKLAKNWKNETGGFSLAASKINNDHYFSIIGLGLIYRDKIIKLILEDLKNSTVYWHYALRKITNENIVPREFQTNVQKTRDLWLNWGREQGII
jgi:hypothetical protein